MITRINHIYTARGIAILLVVLGHCFHSAEAPLNRVILSFHMPLFFVAMSFSFCGAFNKKALFVEQKENRIQDLCMIILIAVLVVISQLNTPVKMYQNEYGVFPLFLLSSFVGIWLVLEISKKLTNTALLNEMGRLSIAVYFWNFLIVGITLRVINSIIKNFGMENDSVFTALVFIISILIIYAISKITYNKLPFLYGIKKNKA